MKVKQASFNLLVYSLPIVTSEGHIIMCNVTKVAGTVFFNKPRDLAVRFKFNTEVKAILQKAASKHSFNLEGPLKANRNAPRGAIPDALDTQTRRISRHASHTSILSTRLLI